MEIVFTNNDYDFRDRLKYLYKEVLDIDTDNTRGWAMEVSRQLYKSKICTFTNGYGDNYNTKTEKDRDKKEIEYTSKMLYAHVVDEKYKDVRKVDTKYVYLYTRLFSVTSDYLLGLTDNPTPSKTSIPLSLKAINALNKAQVDGDLVSWISANKIPRLIPCIDTLLGCPSFYKFLYAFMRYSTPATTPAKMILPNPDNTETTLTISEDTLQAVYKNEVDGLLRDMSKEYIKKSSH